MILEAPRVYLDTAHLRHIAKLRWGEPLPDERKRGAYEFLNECILEGYCGIIFNAVLAPLEWADGDATIEYANRLAAIFDSAKLQYHFEGDTQLCTGEVLRECRRLEPKLKTPELPILQLRLHDGTIINSLVLLSTVPDFVGREEFPQDMVEQHGAESPIVSVRDHVAQAFQFRQNSPTTYRERVDGYQESLLADMEATAAGRKITRHEINGWMRRHLQIDKILSFYNPGCDTAALIEGIEIENCPGVSLWLKARQQRIRAKHGPKDSDVGDWSFLPIVPYCDLVVTDRGFRAVLHQADPSLEDKVTSDPSDAERILGRWLR